MTRSVEKIEKTYLLNNKNDTRLFLLISPGHGTKSLDDEHISEKDLTNQELIDELTIDELSERLEELKIQKDDFSNKKLLEEIEALQNDIQRLQTDTDFKETRSKNKLTNT